MSEKKDQASKPEKNTNGKKEKIPELVELVYLERRRPSTQRQSDQLGGGCEVHRQQLEDREYT